MKRMDISIGKQSILVLGLALLCMLLTACGSNVGSTTTGSNGSSSTTGNNPAVTSTTGSAPTAGAQNCGTIHSQRLLVVPADRTHALSNENCFWQAYQQCHNATLNYSQGGVDTVTIHTFSLKSQGSTCVITDTVKHQVLPRPAQTVATYTCMSLTQRQDGLHFASCSKEGEIVVPAGGVD